MLNVNLIEQYRIKKHLSKGEMSKLIGLKQSNYSMLLKHKTTSLGTLYQIARALGVSPKRLIED